MLNDLLGKLWRRAPGKLRRWAMRFSHPRFAVTAGAIVTDARGRVLLLKHRFRPGAGWGIPGGFLEKGEQPHEAVRRELREETGLEIEDIEILTTRAFRKPVQVEIVFRCQAVGDPDRLNFEIQKAAWFTKDDLPAELPDDQARLIRRALNDGAVAHD
jgi:ADP-ribose pyrophosphatase YjhB (NUDIX family)